MRRLIGSQRTISRERYHARCSTTSSAKDVVEAGQVMWTPSQERVSSSRITAFAQVASERSGQDLRRYAASAIEFASSTKREALGSLPSVPNLTLHVRLPRNYGIHWTELHRWSVTEIGPFWQTMSDFCGMRWIERGHGKAYTPPTRKTLPAAMVGGGRGKPPKDVKMTQARWFEGAKLNFAHNLLPPPTDNEVMVSVSESPALSPRRLTGRQMHVLVAKCSRALRAAGVCKGDRVAGVMTNSQDAIVCMLAATAIGAVWSSCSPDFGVVGVSDRLGQISPKLVFFSLGYLYGGKWHDCRKLAVDVLQELPGSPTGVGVPYWPAGDNSDPDPLSASDPPPSLLAFDDFLEVSSEIGDGGFDERGRGWRGSAAAEGTIEFEATPFDHPAFIMFSSGTTGLPKCMVHGVGGTLLQQKKELVLHCDVRGGDRLMFFSTLGWMMWNWSAAVLSVEAAALVAYDGSPGYPDMSALWRVAAKEGVTHLGASPKYFGACKQKGVVPSVDCSSDRGLVRLRTVLSTGSPLLPEHFRWIYDAVKRDVHLASISGGTDILGCFALGNPTLPVRAGHLQCLGLGMDVCAYRGDDAKAFGEGGSDSRDGGADRAASPRVTARGEMGELVCRQGGFDRVMSVFSAGKWRDRKRTPFPSMPVYFWGDTDGSKYRSAYFEAFREEREGEAVWAHGDYVMITEEGSVVISGRSDAVLNPGGVRIGTSEIYRQVEMVPEVEDSVAVGLRIDGDMAVVLFIKLKSSQGEDHSRPLHGGFYELTGELERKIKATIRSNLTARHVPWRVVVVADVPYTRSGKKVEVAVTKSIHGDPVNNVSALANPDSLRQYRDAGMALRGLVPFPVEPPSTAPISRL